jgi:hypothetical protein
MHQCETLEWVKAGVAAFEAFVQSLPKAFGAARGMAPEQIDQARRNYSLNEKR